MFSKRKRLQITLKWSRVKSEVTYTDVKECVVGLKLPAGLGIPTGLEKLL